MSELSTLVDTANDLAMQYIRDKARFNTVELYAAVREKMPSPPKVSNKTLDDMVWLVIAGLVENAKKAGYSVTPSQ